MPPAAMCSITAANLWSGITEWRYSLGAPYLRYPKLNIREQMAAYQEVIDRSALNEEKLRLPTSREDR